MKTKKEIIKSLGLDKPSKKSLDKNAEEEVKKIVDKEN